MKNLFTFKNGTAQVRGTDEPSAFLSSEVKSLGEWAQKISQRLGHDGPVKVIHQDQSGVVGCQVEEDFSGRGQHIEQVAFSHANLLSSL